MDPLSHGLLGAAAAYAVYGRVLPRSAAWIGFGAALLADLDVLIRIPGDPVLALTLHRHFTHALAFVPTGGLLAAALIMWLPAFRGRRNEVLGAAVVAYLTHPLLDAATSYGTSLLWPVSDARVALDLISVIDPLFTAMLLIAVVWAVWRQARTAAVVGLIVATAYLGMGLVQRERALSVQAQLASERGHTITRGRAMPTLGNLVLWRSLYLADDGRLYADAVRLAPWKRAEVRTGESVPHLDLAALETGDASTDLTLQRYARFADGFTAFVPGRRDLIADLRYARDPAGLSAIWGVRVDEFTIVPVTFESSREKLWPDLRQTWWQVIAGFDAERAPSPTAERSAGDSPATR